MKKELFQDTVEIPSDCQITIEGKEVIVKGSKGEIRKNLFNPLIAMNVENNNVILSVKALNKSTKKIINTFKAHLVNTFKGVNQGHVYKLRICSGHFPMTVTVKNDIFEIKNFIGEKVPRQISIKEGTSVKIDGTEIIVDGIEKEKVGQMAASIEQLTRRPGFDQRIFQDGIYIIEKDGKEIK